jgi:hypothetical protein
MAITNLECRVSNNPLPARRLKMRKKGYILVAVLAAGFLLTGCAAQLSQADRDLLNQAKEASVSASQSAQAAAGSVAQAESAVQRADAAAMRADAAASRAEAAAKRAEAAANSAEVSASGAKQSAADAKKAFEMSLKK